MSNLIGRIIIFLLLGNCISNDRLLYFAGIIIVSADMTHELACNIIGWCSAMTDEESGCMSWIVFREEISGIHDDETVLIVDTCQGHHWVSLSATE